MMRKVSPTVTPEMAAMIKRMKASLPLAQHEIAAMFGVNPGRIAEITKGHKFLDTEPASVAALVNYFVERGTMVRE